MTMPLHPFTTSLSKTTSKETTSAITASTARSSTGSPEPWRVVSGLLPPLPTKQMKHLLKSLWRLIRLRFKI